MTLEALADERALRLLADQLFVFTDEKRWTDLEALFVDGDVAVDMTSLVGGAPVTMTAADLLAGFRQGLHVEKASHHMTTNVRIEIDGDAATIRTQGYAWNHLSTGGGTDFWETWGTYLLTARRTDAGWKLASFRYDAKLNRGNEAVRTHTLGG
ncbi:MAG: nuclear transport factor 2 family protein [Bacteroidota bacterium]